MHAARRRPPTSRRDARGRRGRYTICGLPHVAPLARRRHVWAPGALCIAVAMCALGVAMFSPVERADPAAGSLVSRFTFEDFANVSR